jgi:hypothetical protein
MMICAICANVTRAAPIGDRFWCKEACHASFLDAFQCTVSLDSPEKVLRAAHMTFVHAIFLRSHKCFAQSLRILSSPVRVGHESGTSVAPTW